jgi:hypothetical protein
MPAPKKSIPEPWRSFLVELDTAVDCEVRLDCRGGFVVTLVYGLPRPTGDIDVLEITPAKAGKVILQLGMLGGPSKKNTRSIEIASGSLMCRKAMQNG